MRSHPSSQTDNPNIVIIGAGIGGLSFAIALKRQLGFLNFKVYEKASDVGGTWRDNVYPGCSSDIAIHFYCLSTDLKPDWTYSHSFQPEIQEYWSQLTHKYDLSPHIVFNSKVLSVNWDDTKQLYLIVTEDVRTGTKTSTTANVVISALGVLEVPRFPDIPGISTFNGPAFHSAKWDNSVDLRGKRVAVIGNGASATQFVPIISRDPNVQVTQFCRTPKWILPPLREHISSRMKWILANVPFCMRLHRIYLYFRSELLYFLVFSNGITRRSIAKSMSEYMLQAAPPKYHDKLIPSYPPGCRRLLFDTDYTSALHRPNLTLTSDRIASIVESGIVTDQGETIPFDVIIFATGYTTDSYPLSVRGSNKQTIQEYYNSQGGPTAYNGTAVPGFPNFYMLSGPNTTTGHTSVIFIEEVQINYILKLVQPVLQRSVSSFEVTPEATDAYNAKIQARLSRSVFPHCSSWYRTGGNGKVTSVFPGPGLLFWWWLRRPDWRHYKAVGAENWAVGEDGARYWRWFGRLMVGIAVCGGVCAWWYAGM